MSRQKDSRLTRALEHDFGSPAAIAIGVVAGLSWSLYADGAYQHFTNGSWHVRFLEAAHLNSTRASVTSGLMTIFFFAVGLELSREIHIGNLRRLRHSVPPIFGAIGGMVATALASLLVGTFTHTSALRHGWGVPMATDIAFTLGVLALVGGRVPATLRLFLLTLAIADDVLSVVILSVTGVTHVRVAGLVALGTVIIVVRLLARRHPSNAWRITVLIATWLCLVWANVEPPLAGVLAAMVVPFDSTSSVALERRVSRWSTGLVLPLFALVSCGLNWSSISLRGDGATIILSMIGVRTIGKMIGITSGVALARALGFRLHSSITWSMLGAASLLCAIGFTVPLLFAGSLFATTGQTYGAFTIGLLAASFVASILGGLWMWTVARPH